MYMRDTRGYNYNVSPITSDRRGKGTQDVHIVREKRKHKCDQEKEARTVKKKRKIGSRRVLECLAHGIRGHDPSLRDEPWGHLYKGHLEAFAVIME
jgi:hypothetical protein